LSARPGCVAWLEAFQATDDGYAGFFAGIGLLDTRNRPNGVVRLRYSPG